MLPDVPIRYPHRKNRSHSQGIKIQFFSMVRMDSAEIVVFRRHSFFFAVLFLFLAWPRVLLMPGASWLCSQPIAVQILHSQYTQHTHTQTQWKQSHRSRKIQCMAGRSFSHSSIHGTQSAAHIHKYAHAHMHACHRRQRQRQQRWRPSRRFGEYAI